MKVFFAVWLDTYTLTAIEALQAKVLKFTGGRPTVPEAMHLTLSFVGEISPDRLSELVEIGNQIQQVPFQFPINKVACFEASRVAWAGTKDVPAQLIDLQANIDSAVAKAGFPLDPRPFRPHVTLIRKLPAPFETMSTQELVWPIAAFSLVQANPTEGGLPYKVLHAWPLKG